MWYSGLPELTAATSDDAEVIITSRDQAAPDNRPAWEVQVHTTAAVQGRRGLAQEGEHQSSASTAAAKRRPRSSKFLNMSRLAQAGESSTASPDSAHSAARCTASSRLATRISTVASPSASARRGRRDRAAPRLGSNAPRERAARRSRRPCRRRRRSAPACRRCRRRGLRSRQRSTDVGGLGVVVIADTGTLTDPLATVRQTGETTQRIQHGAERQPHRVPECQRSQALD